MGTNDVWQHGMGLNDAKWDWDWDRKKMNVWIYKHHKNNHNPFNGAARSTTAAAAVDVEHNRYGRRLFNQFIVDDVVFAGCCFARIVLLSLLTDQNEKATTIFFITCSMIFFAFWLFSLGYFYFPISFILLLLSFFPFVCHVIQQWVGHPRKLHIYVL